MGLYVNPMTINELASFLFATGTFSTVQEAIQALNMVIIEDVGVTSTALAVSGGPADLVVGTVGETALQLAAESQLAATGTGVSTSGVGIVANSSGTINATALLGMEVGVVGAAVAPLLGVALGAGLYNENPELWRDISVKLLPFCYPGTTEIPTWGDISNDIWRALIPKRIYDALKELFDEKGIGKPTGQGTIIDPASSVSGLQYTTIADGQHAGSFDTSYWRVPQGEFRFAYHGQSTICASTASGTARLYAEPGSSRVLTDTQMTLSYTYEGKTVYYRATERAVSTIPVNFPGAIESTGSFPGSKYGQIAWDIIFGRSTDEKTFPAGTGEWTGNIPADPSGPSIITGVDGQGNPITQPSIIISPPITAPTIIQQPLPDIEPGIIPFPWPEPSVEPHTRPWPTTMPWPLPQEQPSWWPTEIPYPNNYPVQYPSPDSTTQPDPSQITDPDSQISPYIIPTPLPWDPLIPTTTPPGITLDPSLPPNPDPDDPDGRINLPDIIPTPAPSGISPWPDMPGTDVPFAQNIGLVTVYHPTSEQLYNFERWLWVTLSQASVETVWNNPFDGVIGLFELYCTPTDIGTRSIHSGFLDSGIDSAVISRYTQIDCGTLGIPEYYGNYLDYSPYTKAHIYLPFIGVQELNPDDIVGHAVNVTYRIDEYNGSCIAMITVAKVTKVNDEDVEYSNTMYQFSGNCSVDVPIAGGSQAAIKAGLMQADAYQRAGYAGIASSLIGGLGSAIGGAITGLPGFLGGALNGLGGAFSQYMTNQANYLSNMLSGKSTVAKSGSFGASHGALGIKKPFITITRPKQIQVANYNELYGYQAHKLVKVGDCEGYLRCREVHVVSATATDAEKSIIESMLKSGVYVYEDKTVDVPTRRYP